MVLSLVQVSKQPLFGDAGRGGGVWRSTGAARGGGRARCAILRRGCDRMGTAVGAERWEAPEAAPVEVVRDDRPRGARWRRLQEGARLPRPWDASRRKPASMRSG